jgi:hypothetical protein
MRSNSGRKKTMIRVADISRSAALALVNREERRLGSRMLAYETVSQKVGMSSDWLRKFISSNVKEPGLTVGFNLMLLYRRVCERVERAAEQERQLREEIDEALASIGLVVAGTSATDQQDGTPGKGD